MIFCIASIEYWSSIGFDTTHWRKSNDESKALVHEQFAEVLVNTSDNANIQRYLCPSEEFSALMNSEEWSIETA
jgi:hypothetical protein